MTTPKNEPVDPPEGGDNSGAEDSFWTKFDERIDAGVKRAIETHLKPGSARTGRTTLPGIIADIFYGKAPQK